ncbi:MAG: hypothetical protein H6500_04065 [Candidatus Woesearchaeota archaeon]|nr:hypothetical protein [Nanoarchaeota archaeon]USN43543.1 MAG: hypothetical protein H6500_04065 [Candidatus Woesearchaeota archaeon]
MEKKAEIHTVFIFILSIIMILFIGYLVTKFTLTFVEDKEMRENSLIYTHLRADIEKVASNYGSEKFAEYKVSSKAQYLCVASQSFCSPEGTLLPESTLEKIQVLYETGSNVVLLDNSAILTHNKIENINADPACFCVKISKGIIKLFIENRNNKVFVTPLDDE